MTNRLQTATLLLVDDDPTMVQFLRYVIERSFPDRVKLESVTDATEANRYLMTHIVDLLITDLDMPGMNGLDLLQAAKHRNALTQVMFITGHCSSDTILEALEGGASDYLVKPLQIEQVVELIEQAFARLQRWRQSLAEALRSSERASATS